MLNKLEIGEAKVEFMSGGSYGELPCMKLQLL